MTERILTVDKNDKELSFEDKMYVHRNGVLHRAFSVLIYNEDRAKMLLQRRSACKYHSPNLWSNACCSHVKEDWFCNGLSLEEMASVRLEEELALKLGDLLFDRKIHYKTKVGGLVENEIDYIFSTTLSEKYHVNPNSLEVSETKWMEVKKLKEDIKNNLSNYTSWLRYVI